MYKYSKFPENIDSGEYTRQENIFVEFLKDIPAFTSLYSIGELSLFGVSDLDYLIVYSGNIDKIKIHNFTLNYSLIDTVLFIDESELKDVKYISHHTNYQLVSGKDIKIGDYINTKNLNIIYAWRVCFFSLLRNFYYYKYNKKIFIKNLLSQINDMRYPIFFLRQLGVETKKYDDFILEFQEYRSTYFLHQDYHKLRQYLNQAMNLSWDLIFDLQPFLSSSNNGSNMFGRFPTNFCTYCDNDRYKVETEKKLNLIGRFSRFLCLPNGYDYRSWDKDLLSDLNKIQSNNKGFLNFSLPTKKGILLLQCKKIFDYIFSKISL